MIPLPRKLRGILAPTVRIVLGEWRRVLVAVLLATSATVIVASVASRSWTGLLGAAFVLGAAVVGALAEAIQNRRAYRALAAKMDVLEREYALLASAARDEAARDRDEAARDEIVREAAPVVRSDDPSALLAATVRVVAVSRGLLERGDALEAYAIAAGAGALGALGPATLRRLREELRKRGYFTRAREVGRIVLRLDGRRGTGDRQALRWIEGEIAFLSGGVVPAFGARDRDVRAKTGRVLHLVSYSLPVLQSGYTLRTQYTVAAQQRSGLDPHVVTQMGIGVNGTRRISEDVEGIAHHRLPGPVRGTVPLDRWFERHVRGVASVVEELRPALLHAASDFINARTATLVGKAYGIPVVYESRGFWEETWLSRQANEYGWADLDELAKVHGLPEGYLWRRDLEDEARRNADRVVTLADVMADRIEAGGVSRDRIAVIPNAVDVDSFPVLHRDGALAAKLGIAENMTVIGYISSIVEYEGIDTLVAAYAAIKQVSPTPVALLIVGEGSEREGLMRQAEALGAADVIFTGKVGHDAVLDYYGMIDIFVVPRRPVEVCHLVTPLKPFEAFSTARTVVMSDVRALASIAKSSGAAELFVAGDPRSLADVLLGLLKDPDRRAQLAATGSAWVRSERTWDANAQAYLRLYRELGVVPMPASIPRQLRRSSVADQSQTA